MKSNLSFFNVYVFLVIAENSLLTQSHKSFPIFFPTSFIVLSFIFRTIIHFELIITYGVGYGSMFVFVWVWVFCTWLANCLSIIWWTLLFLHWIEFAPFQKPVVHICVCLFLDFLFCSFYLFIYLCQYQNCLDYNSFIVSWY